MGESQRKDFLDADLRGRLRGSAYQGERKPVQQPARRISDFQQVQAVTPLTKPINHRNQPGQVTVDASPSVAKPSVLHHQQGTTAIQPDKKTGVKPAVPRQRRSKVLRRQPLRSSTKKSKKFKINRSTAILWSMAGIIFIIGIAVSLLSLRTNHTAIAQVTQLAQKNEQGSSDIPSEDPPDDINKYHVAADLPRFISIAKLNVRARVLRLGVKDNNELKAPGSIFDTGWYEGSSKPGEAGAMLIDGHVQGVTKPGVFVNLKKLVAADTLTIERGDGKVLNYKVIKTETVPANKVDMAAALASIVPGKNGLNIITCAGAFNKATNSYADRLVVYAVQTN